MASTNIAPTAQRTDWRRIKSMFDLNAGFVHLAGSQFLVSHPQPVREAIARHREALDRDPVGYTLAHETAVMDAVRQSAARYFGVPNPSDIAVTGSTTMGLGILYGGLRIAGGDEILIPEDDYYSHLEAVHRCADRTGSVVRLLKLFERPAEATEDGIVDAVLRSISDRTRVLGMSWVHSNTGIKTPIARIARELKRLNESRSSERRVRFVVDGVHGFGVETETFGELGCDYFASGCHKWLYGPRGTGILVSTPDAWQQTRPIIPTFTETMTAMERQRDPKPSPIDGKLMTPGGFHALEHRWALVEAFAFAESIGKSNIRDRVYELNRRLKEGLRKIKRVVLHTPTDSSLSAGITAFEIEGISTKEAVDRLLGMRVVATAAPYYKSCIRLTPGIYNTPEEVDRGLEAVEALARG